MKLSFILPALLIFGLLDPINAKSTGSSSSGFSSSRSSSSSSSRPSSSSSSFKPSTSPSNSFRTGSSGPSSSNKSWGGSNSSTTTTKSAVVPTKINGSKVDASAYKAAVKSGTFFKSKDEAISAFKQKNATSFTNKFDTEPASRPNYIPSTTSVGGTTYNVSYNPQQHGYGYYSSPGVWRPYDTFRDSLMLAALMDHDNYVVASPGSSVVHSNSGMGFFAWLVFIITLCLLLGGLFIFFMGARETWSTRR